MITSHKYRASLDVTLANALKIYFANGRLSPRYDCIGSRSAAEAVSVPRRNVASARHPTRKWPVSGRLLRLFPALAKKVFHFS